jgi:hypothetical protein
MIDVSIRFLMLIYSFEIHSIVERGLVGVSLVSISETQPGRLRLGSFKERTQRDGPQLWYRLLVGRVVCSILDNVIINCRHNIIIPASENLEGYNHRLPIIIALSRMHLYLFEPPILSPLDTLSFLPLCHDDLSHIEEVGVFLHRYYLMNFSFLNCG